MQESSVNIIIVGSGFAGVECARKLAKDSRCSVTLIGQEDSMEYYPAAFRVFSSNNTRLSLIPVRDIVPQRVHFIVDKVVSTDVVHKTVSLSSGDVIEGDYIVLAAGSESAYYNIPGVSEYAFPFRTSADVLRIREHIDSLLHDSVKASPDEQLTNLRFVVVGAGPAGCEIAAGIAVHAHERAHHYGVPHDLVSVNLLEGRDRILSTFSKKFSEAVSHRLRALGVQIMPYRKLIEGKSWTAILQDMQMGTRTIIWTAGVEPAPLVKNLDLPKNPRGKVLVDKHLCVQGYGSVYAVGDIADTPNSGLAQTAIHDGACVAQDIIARLDNSERESYQVPSVSHIVPLHRWQGVVEVGGVVVGGFVGWIARAVADMGYLLPRVGFIKTVRRVLESI